MIFPDAEWDELGVPQFFRDILRDTAHIPPHETTDATLVAQRRRQLAELRPRLQAALMSEEMRPALERALERINGMKGGVEGDARSFDRLHELLEQQPYRLAYWRVSSEEINYRRFFDINDLAGLRMENAEVFAATHGLIRRLLARGEVTGLRIDHADGMFNPRQYLIRLQLLYVAAHCCGETAQGPTGENGIENGGARCDAGVLTGRLRRVRCTWWWRRFWSRVSRCRRSGRYVGHRATTSFTRGTRFSFARRMSNGSRISTSS
jgi:(1->4)-alpha-D-glucan 1-alpha-D-glucosylmutase